MLTLSLSGSAPALRRLTTLVGLALAVSAGSIHAQETDSMFSFSGFGTLGYANSSSTDADYTAGIIQPKGTGRTRSWAPIDTKLAGQVSLKVNDQFSAVLQVLSTLQPEGNYKPVVEWANVKYAVTPELAVVVGRVVLPSYMVSETRSVGYSNPWVRVPVEMYMNPITNMDGINVSYRKNVNGYTNTLQAFYGKSKLTIVQANGTYSDGAKADSIRGFADTLEFGSWTLRAAALWIDLALPRGPVFLDAPTKGTAIGVTYDPGSWFVMSELSTTAIQAIRDARSGYVTAGVRLAAFTPYVTYSKIEQASKKTLVTSGQTSTAIGVRWDFRPRMALKAQYDHVKTAPNSYGTFTNIKPGIINGSSDVASVALDFVF